MGGSWFWPEVFSITTVIILLCSDIQIAIRFLRALYQVRKANHQVSKQCCIAAI
jgi:hypothetical protein